MKLISKYNRVTIPIAVFVLLISSIAFYFILHFVLLLQIDKDLRIEQQEIIHYIEVKGTLPETSNYRDQQIEFHPTSLTRFNEQVSTESIYNKKEDESEPFRRIDFLVQQNGQSYIATVKKSQQETEDIVRLILMITFSVIAILLLILFIANRFFLAKLWKPFYNTLEQLKGFSLSSTKEIQLHSTNVDEFTELNATAMSLTQKVRHDYEALKSFTGNASHEIQTPLAIIKNKIELLFQYEHLEESQVIMLQSMYQAASRLSRLIQALLLLAKIENSQFQNVEEINLSELIKKNIEHFREAAFLKSITISENIQGDVFVAMNEPLAEILFSNILMNAIKHNYESGSINVDLNEQRLILSNTGYAPALTSNEVFDRFAKNSSSEDSLGLGLSIVKAIADIYQFSISYYFQEEVHFLEIRFFRPMKEKSKKTRQQ